MYIFAMIVKIMKKITLFFFASLLLLSCSNDDTSNTRIYVEGIIKTSLPANEIELKLVNEERTISSTKLESNGQFIMSGPVFSGNTTLISNQKIKMFSSDKQGLQISGDSLSIIIPSTISYLKFNEIQLAR